MFSLTVFFCHIYIITIAIACFFYFTSCTLLFYPMQHRFYFDQVFGEESSNEEVYQSTAYPLVQHMLSG